jgi:hypothetical protein
METLENLALPLDGALMDPADLPLGSEGKGYRPMPRDFVEMFPRLTWDAAKIRWHVHGRTMARWVDQAGRDKMKLARLAYRRAHETIESRERRRRYLAGKTRNAVVARVGKEDELAARLLICRVDHAGNGGH